MSQFVTQPTRRHELDLGRHKILIVDDDPGPRRSMRMILCPRHDVIEASDANEALRLLDEHDVDLMTLDLNMPGMNGDELLRIVRKLHPKVEIVIVTGHPSIDSATEALRLGVGDYLRKPFDVVQVNAAVGRSLKRRGGRMILVDFLEKLSVAVGERGALCSVLDRVDLDPAARRRVGDLIETLGATNAADLPVSSTLGFLEVMANAVESQCEFLRGHARRTSFYAGLLADRLALTADEREHVRIAGFLHDIGKIGIPSGLLTRDGPLDLKEQVVVHRHPEIGARLVEPLGLAPEIGSAILHHHEWWDGRGYCGGLFGEQIPVAARIVGLVDAYDAMTSSRPYRPPLSAGTVTDELEKYAGVQFDPELTHEFLGIIRGSEIELPLLAEPAAGSLVPSGMQHDLGAA